MIYTPYALIPLSLAQGNAKGKVNLGRRHHNQELTKHQLPQCIITVHSVLVMVIVSNNPKHSCGSEQYHIVMSKKKYELLYSTSMYITMS